MTKNLTGHFKAGALMRLTGVKIEGALRADDTDQWLLATHVSRV